ncbi:MAG: hypothetical protein A2002_07135 [Pseudomonadales bacterium GWC1_66_9]|nr:MAG: hypothetical protein A2002_07135 [Pseudomonadales bacterium GWC1_66_9]
MHGPAILGASGRAPPGKELPAMKCRIHRQDSKWLRRILWLVMIWAAGVSCLGVLAYGLRLIMRAAGMTM